MKAFHEKAALFAKGLQADSYRVIRIGGGGSPYRAEHNMGRAMAMKAAEAAPPAISAGESRIQVTVTGEIEVEFRDFKVE